MKYLYSVRGEAADGQTWAVNGELDNEGFPPVPEAVMRAAFRVLTDGKAVYGQPGKGCRGPYKVTRMLIEAYDERSH